MPKPVPENEISIIMQAVARFPYGGSIDEIDAALNIKLPRRTLQRRLALLVEQKRLTMEGRGRASRYRSSTTIETNVGEVQITFPMMKVEADAEVYVPLE